MDPLAGKTANTPRLEPVSTLRQRIAERARHALGMAWVIFIASWTNGYATARSEAICRGAGCGRTRTSGSVGGARVSNDPGLPDHDTVVIPPARTANVSGHGPRSPARDRTITVVQQLGRRRWKKTSGYHRQSRVENTCFRYTSIIGDGLRARSPAGQGSEVVLGCEILNRMTELGRPVSYRIGR